MPLAYYNENDAYAAQWLRNLISAGLIPEGFVDQRDIRDVQPADLDGYDQCHFFAGIAGWSLALELAGWPDSRPVWTGSCPCQPFSQAGAGAGFADERHLWPEFFRLIAQCKPAIVIGEQVSSKDGFAWLDLVQDNLDREDYAFGALDICAAGVGAPHIRQRLYWVANAAQERRSLRCEQSSDSGNEQRQGPAALRRGFAGELGSSSRARSGRHAGTVSCLQGSREGQRGRAGCEPDEPVIADDTRELGDADDEGSQVGSVAEIVGRSLRIKGAAFSAASPLHGFWRGADWILCRDPGGYKYRPVDAGTFPLAAGVPNRVGKLRAAGNSIVPQVAAEFIRAFLDSELFAVETV